MAIILIRTTSVVDDPVLTDPGRCRRIQFLMWQPGGNVKKVAGSHHRAMLAVISPAHSGLSLNHEDNRVLLAMMMDACLARRLDQKCTRP
jgi:hypothetical protein